MADWSNEVEAREKIKSMVADYYRDFKALDKEKTLSLVIEFPMHLVFLMKKKCVVL